MTFLTAAPRCSLIDTRHHLTAQRVAPNSTHVPDSARRFGLPQWVAVGVNDETAASAASSYVERVYGAALSTQGQELPTNPANYNERPVGLLHPAPHISPARAPMRASATPFCWFPETSQPI